MAGHQVISFQGPMNSWIFPLSSLALSIFAAFFEAGG
jgi:hypothetical protein